MRNQHRDRRPRVGQKETADTPDQYALEHPEPDDIRTDIDGRHSKPDDAPIIVKTVTKKTITDCFEDPAKPVQHEIYEGTEKKGEITAHRTGFEVARMYIEFSPSISLFKEEVQEAIIGKISLNVLPLVKAPDME